MLFIFLLLIGTVHVSMSSEEDEELILLLLLFLLLFGEPLIKNTRKERKHQCKEKTEVFSYARE